MLFYHFKIFAGTASGQMVKRISLAKQKEASFAVLSYKL